MTAAIFAYSSQGMKTARRVRQVLTGMQAHCFAPQRLADGDFDAIPKPSQSFYGEWFSQAEVLIFVGSCGIAVRQIAPYVHSKTSDPAVLCLDELGQFVIPLLSGHIGGANALARELSKELGATAVITTATDINGRFSVDAWAAERGFSISNMASAKAVSAAILEGEVPLKSDFPISDNLPSGVIPGERGKVGIFLTYGTEEPFDSTLRLLPKVLHLGIGCRKGISAETIEDVVCQVLQQHHIDRRSIARVASIDRKAQEPGLLEFCEKNHWQAVFYTAQELSLVGGAVSSSSFVESVVGVDNVCERAALMEADKLLVNKTARDGVTVALALKSMEVQFGETVCGGHWPRKL